MYCLAESRDVPLVNGAAVVVFSKTRRFSSCSSSTLEWWIPDYRVNRKVGIRSNIFAPDRFRLLDAILVTAGWPLITTFAEVHLGFTSGLHVWDMFTGRYLGLSRNEYRVNFVIEYSGCNESVTGPLPKYFKWQFSWGKGIQTYVLFFKYLPNLFSEIIWEDSNQVKWWVGRDWESEICQDSASWNPFT